MWGVEGGWTRTEKIGDSGQNGEKDVGVEKKAVMGRAWGEWLG